MPTQHTSKPWNPAWVFLAAVLLAPTEVQAEYAPQVGEPHPDFLLPLIGSREPVSLSQFRGKPVLLMHFASW